MDLRNLNLPKESAMSEKKVVALKGAEQGSKMQNEFLRDQALAEQYLAEANVKDLYELYQHRCEQLQDFGGTLSTMAEIYAGKGSRGEFQGSPDAIKAMERVALAAIELAKAVTGKGK
jgi:hypothetical protein